MPKNRRGCFLLLLLPGHPAADIYTIFSQDYSKKDGYVKDADLGLGCGMPTDTAAIKPGETVIDLGRAREMMSLLRSGLSAQPAESSAST